MTNVTDVSPLVFITHDGIRFQFDKLYSQDVDAKNPDITPEIAQFRFARIVEGGSNADRTARYAVEPVTSGEQPIPEPVLNELQNRGLTPR